MKKTKTVMKSVIVLMNQSVTTELHNGLYRAF